MGFLSKLLAEAVEEMSMKPVEAVRATGASFLSVVVMAVMPQVMPRFVGFCAYQLDSNLRNSALVGLVGVRVGLAALFMSLSLSVTWIFAALLGDYLIKALMLVHRFRSGRWKNKMRRYDFAS